MSILKMGPKSSPPAAPAAVGVAPVQAQLSRAGLSFTLYRPPTQRGRGASSVGGTASGVAKIGGIALGGAGDVAPLAAFVLAFGEDFDVRPATWSAINPGGKFNSSGVRFQNANDEQIYLDPDYRGPRTQAPAALGLDGLACAGSIGSFTIANVTAGMKPNLPNSWGLGGDVDGYPKVYTSTLRSSPNFLLSAKADFALDCLIKFPLGTGHGWWQAFWETAFGSYWPDHQELDVVESQKNNAGDNLIDGNINGSTTDGGGNVPVNVEVDTGYPTSRFVRCVGVKQGTTVAIYDDVAVAGTLALRATFTNSRVSRFRGAHDIRIDHSINTARDGFAFSAGDWPKVMQYDWIRVWVPAATYLPPAPTKTIAVVNTTPGGSWAFTLPPTGALFNNARPGLEQVFQLYDNMDAPGLATRALGLPGGMSVSLATRAVTGTVPTTEGGRATLLLSYAFDDGGPAERAILYYNVAPAVQDLPGNQGVFSADPFTQVIGQQAFHSGNLYPHVYQVTKVSGGAWLSISGNGTNNVTLTGTPADTATLSIACTNAIGQTTTVTRTLTPVTVVNQEAHDYIARMTPFPTAARIALIDSLFTALKAGAISGTNLLTKGDFLYLFKAHAAQAALLNAFSTSFTATLSNVPAFTVDTGYATDGVDDDINSNFDPSPGAFKFVRDSASFGLWITDNAVAPNNCGGFVDGSGNGSGEDPRFTGDLFRFRITQGATASSFANANSIGWSLVNRSAAGATQAYINGVAQTVTTSPNQASVAIPAGTFRIGGDGRVASFAAHTFRGAWAGSSLTANESLDLYNALNTYFAAF